MKLKIKKEKIGIRVYFTPEVFKKLEEKRGSIKKSTFLEKIILKYLEDCE